MAQPSPSKASRRDDPEEVGADEELDSRVEGALMELNAATDDINVKEGELEVSQPL